MSVQPNNPVPESLLMAAGSTSDLFTLVCLFSRAIDNGRTLRSTFNYAKDEEMHELDTEITAVENGEPEGVDGVVGEAMDNALCHLDIIFQHKPDITHDEFMRLARAKLTKWYEKHADKAVRSS